MANSLDWLFNRDKWNADTQNEVAHAAAYTTAQRVVDPNWNKVTPGGPWQLNTPDVNQNFQQQSGSASLPGEAFKPKTPTETITQSAQPATAASVAPAQTNNHPSPTFFGGQQTIQDAARTRNEVVGNYGGYTTNPYKDRANPYAEGNRQLVDRNARGAAEVQHQADSTAKQLERRRAQMGMGANSGLAAEDRRNVEQSRFSTMSDILNGNRIQDYDKRGSWDTQNLQLGTQQDSRYLNELMGFQSNDRANFGAGLQEKQFNEQVRQYNLNRDDANERLKAIMAQAATGGFVGALGNAANLYATSPAFKKQVDEWAGAAGKTAKQIMDVISGAFGGGGEQTVGAVSGMGMGNVDYMGRPIDLGGGLPSSAYNGLPTADLSAPQPQFSDMLNPNVPVQTPSFPEPQFGTQAAVGGQPASTFSETTSGAFDAQAPTVQFHDPNAERPPVQMPGGLDMGGFIQAALKWAADNGIPFADVISQILSGGSLNDMGGRGIGFKTSF